MPSSLNLLLPEARPFPRVDIRKALAALCEQFGVEALYAFGSLAGEVSAFVQGLGDLERPGASDVDIGALPEPGRLSNPQERVRLIPVPRPDSASGLPRLAACGKDPAFGPATILEEASRSGRYSAEELRELAYAGAPPDASALARRWRSILDEARALVAALPPDEAGTCVLHEASIAAPSRTCGRLSKADISRTLGSGQIMYSLYQGRQMLDGSPQTMASSSSVSATSRSARRGRTCCARGPRPAKSVGQAAGTQSASCWSAPGGHGWRASLAGI